MKYPRELKDSITCIGKEGLAWLSVPEGRNSQRREILLGNNKRGEKSN